MPAPGLIVLVRHGETAWSRSGRHTSHTNVALTAEGRAQAKRLASLFDGRSIAEVRTSPLDRASETCALLGLAQRAIIDDDLREWDYGDDEGVTTDEIRVSRPGWTVWRDGPLGGERIDDVARRVDRVIERARHAASAGDVVLVGHGHCLRVLAARWLDADPHFGQYLALDAGSMSELGFEREQPVVRTWNHVPRE
jgi:broad specificity phosphatase PhoE